MTDYLLKFPSREVAEQFAISNGFANEVKGKVHSVLASDSHALHEIGSHNGTDYWVLFRDLVGIPIPEHGEQFIFWSSNMTVVDEADGLEVFLPRPALNPDVPNTFWS